MTRLPVGSAISLTRQEANKTLLSFEFHRMIFHLPFPYYFCSDGASNEQERLDEPVHLASLVNNFNERVINTASIWMAKRDTGSVCSYSFVHFNRSWTEKS